MPPMSAAVSPMSSVCGPIATSSAEPPAVSRRGSPTTSERNPAIVQIAVDTSFGLMPVSRARSALVADARTASPKCVCPSSHQSPSVMIGTTMSASSCGPVTVML